MPGKALPAQRALVLRVACRFNHEAPVCGLSREVEQVPYEPAVYWETLRRGCNKGPDLLHSRLDGNRSIEPRDEMEMK